MIEFMWACIHGAVGGAITLLLYWLTQGEL